MKRILFVIIIFLSTSAFAQMSEAQKRVKKGIAGTWLWRKTVCCNMGGGSLKLADPKKKEKTVVLTKDSIVKVFDEDQLVYTGKYSLNEIHFLQDPVRYDLNSEGFRGMLNFLGDTMLVGYCASDGCDEYFVPLKVKKRKARRK